MSAVVPKLGLTQKSMLISLIFLGRLSKKCFPQELFKKICRCWNLFFAILSVTKYGPAKHIELGQNV